MFDRLNELGMRLVRVARETRHPALAVEIYSYLPVAGAAGAKMLRSQLQVVQVLLSLRPSRSQRLNEAVTAFEKELGIVERGLEV